MFASFFEKYKHLQKKAVKPKTDLALNNTYLQLHQAQRAKSFVEVTIDGDNVIYQSMILELDPEERTVLIDELFPTGFLGLPGQKVTLKIRQQGGRKFKLHSVIQEQHQFNGSPLYVLAMPADSETDQRRNSFRLPVGKAAINSKFRGPDRQFYHGRLCNVSSTGVAIEVAADSANSFHYNDRLEHVTFDFAGVDIDCLMAIRNVVPQLEGEGAGADHLLIGAEFIDISELEQRKLERSILRVQRERLKLSANREMQLASA